MREGWVPMWNLRSMLKAVCGCVCVLPRNLITHLFLESGWRNWDTFRECWSYAAWDRTRWIFHLHLPIHCAHDLDNGCWKRKAFNPYLLLFRSFRWCKSLCPTAWASSLSRCLPLTLGRHLQTATAALLSSSSSHQALTPWQLCWNSEMNRLNISRRGSST